ALRERDRRRDAPVVRLVVADRVLSPAHLEGPVQLLEPEHHRAVRGGPDPLRRRGPRPGQRRRDRDDVRRAPHAPRDRGLEDEAVRDPALDDRPGIRWRRGGLAGREGGEQCEADAEEAPHRQIQSIRWRTKAAAIDPRTTKPVTSQNPPASWPRKALPASLIPKIPATAPIPARITVTTVRRFMIRDRSLFTIET